MVATFDAAKFRASLLAMTEEERGQLFERMAEEAERLNDLASEQLRQAVAQRGLSMGDIYSGVYEKD